ncbi:hypothetical protein [Alkalicoccobacillus plakortidis]|uniref:Uncharacterized protein n=1 Tax=Alkalicoccobacillus plakortidis TaxID=444060 RepID=A0ABT0XLT7_9BACI|nr:hypothetical protein [Alkalicoccobacillus plakortidis]MCM2676877.1 hypothetical protein [Alkalicoccobacillus plakortidis]
MRFLKGIMIFLGVIVVSLSVFRFVSLSRLGPGESINPWYTISSYLIIAITLSLLLIVFQKEQKHNKLLLLGWILPLWFVVDAIYEMTRL